MRRWVVLNKIQTIENNFRVGPTRGKQVRAKCGKNCLSTPERKIAHSDPIAMTITFTVHGIPMPQPRPRAFARKFGDTWQARVFNPGTAEGWKSQIAQAAKDLRPAQPIGGAVRLNICFLMPRPKSQFKANGVLRPDAPTMHAKKPDIDNLAKAVMDALTVLGFWTDDGQVCALGLEKRMSSEPGARIEIEEVKEVYW